MDKDINNLEEIINLCKEEINNNDKNITATLDLEDLKSLMNFVDRYKQLEEENKKLNKMLYLCTPEIPQNNHCKYISYVDIVKKLADSIPTSKVKEKIEELDKTIEEVEENIENTTDEEKRYWKKEKHDLCMQKYILQNLLGKE